MNAPLPIEYDLNKLEYDDQEVDPSDWNLTSVTNPNLTYKIDFNEVIDYFDYCNRYKVKSSSKQNCLAYFVEFQTQSGQVQEDLVADFYFLSYLKRRFGEKIQGISDVCIEQTTQSLHLVCINNKFYKNEITGENIEYDVDQCLVSKVNELMDQGKLIQLLVKLINFVQQLQEAFYFEYELQNHNIFIIQEADGSYSFSLINQKLPLQYRMEYVGHYQQIYEEAEYEMNEKLLIKKVIFLLFALATEDGVDEYKQLRKILILWDQKKFPLPKKPLQQELLTLTINLIKSLEQNKPIHLGQIKDLLQTLAQPNNQQASTVNNQKSNNISELAKGKRRSIRDEKAKSGQPLNFSDAESSQLAEEDDDGNSDDDNQDDFGCVPVNNIDHDTVHIKVIDDEPKFHQKSQLFMMENDSDPINPNNGYQSDVMKSLHMLGGSSGVTVKTNRFMDPSNEGQQSTIIHVDQIRLNVQSSRGAGGLNRKGTLQTDRERNASADDVDDEEEEETPPKYFKGSQVKNVLTQTSSRGDNLRQSERVGIVSSDFNDKKNSVKYKSFGCTFIVRNAHSDKINCLCNLVNGAFLSGSSDKTIKVWYPLEQKPIGVLEEDEEVTLMLRLGKTKQNDVTLLYVAKNALKFLSIKQQKSVQLFKCDKEITAISKVNSNPSIIALGLSNGIIKDFDVRNKQQIRSVKLHQGSPVNSIISQGKFLISLSDNGTIVVYDYPNQQLYRELKLSEVGIRMPTSLHLIKGDRFLALAEEQGITIIDIENSQIANPTVGNKNISQFVKLTLPNESGQNTFCGISSSGQIKIFAESASEFEDDLKHIECLKQLNGHINQVTNLIQLTNGAMVSCGADKNLCLWEEKKSASACGACCSLF